MRITVHKLRRALGSPGGYLDNIVKGKTGSRGKRLKAMIPDIRLRYATLEGAYTIADIAGVAIHAWSGTEREDLLHCYEVSAESLAELKRLITERQAEGIRDFCPYCGIGAPRQFDHYLPKEKFPEFSVHAHNLMPCCGTCNGKKSDLWIDASGARIFLNFYIDSLPTAPMLKPSIQWVVKNGKRVPAVTFDLVRPARFPVAKFGLIESHFEKLALLSRYRNQAHTEFLILRDAAVAREARTSIALKRFLSRFLQRREATLGPHNWRIALYRAIVVDDPFLRECLKP
jgi:hypothetical protein